MSETCRPVTSKKEKPRILRGLVAIGLPALLLLAAVLSLAVVADILEGKG